MQHIYRPAPSDRQKDMGIVPDMTCQRRTLHLAKVGLEETPNLKLSRLNKPLNNINGRKRRSARKELTFD
jgi:hypothetical protein